MPLDKRELSYLWDMQNAAKEINEFMSGVNLAISRKTKFCGMLLSVYSLSLAKRRIIFLHNFVRNILKFPGKFSSAFETFLRTNMVKVC